MKNIIFIISLFFIGQNLVGQGKNKSKISSFLYQTKKFDGFFDFNYDEKKDIIYLNVKQLSYRFQNHPGRTYVMIKLSLTITVSIKYPHLIMIVSPFQDQQRI